MHTPTIFGPMCTTPNDTNVTSRLSLLAGSTSLTPFETREAVEFGLVLPDKNVVDVWWEDVDASIMSQIDINAQMAAYIAHALVFVLLAATSARAKASVTAGFITADVCECASGATAPDAPPDKVRCGE